MNSFERALKFTLKWEGGYVNHPNDPGGPTNYGITQAVYDKYRRQAQGLSPISVRIISYGEVKIIYRINYWDITQAGAFPYPLALTLFDYAVNSGPRSAVSSFQLNIGACPDGRMGAKSLDAAKVAIERLGVDAVAAQLNQRRRQGYLNLSSTKKYGPFIKGWLNRLDALEKEIANEKGD